MEYRTLGDSDLKLSAITFGAWAAGGWMWGGTEQNNAIAAIQTAYDMGVTSIDTAPVYGQGHSEKIVGKSIQDIPRENVQILTKYGLRWDTKKGKHYFDSQDNDGNDISIHKYAGKDGIIEECENSLRRLDTDYIDLYQIHWPDPTTPIEETMEAVLKLKKQGKIREAGVCNYNVDQMKKAEEVLDLVSNQVPYSMVRRGIEEEIIPYCKDNNKAILAYSPLQRGLLTGKMEPKQTFENGDTRASEYYFSPANIIEVNHFLREIKPIAISKRVALAQLVIQWTLQQSGVDIALVGARNQMQAQQNAEAASLKLSSNEINFINKRLAEVELISEDSA